MSEFMPGQGWPDGVEYPPRQPAQSPRGKFHARAFPSITNEHVKVPFVSEGIVYIFIASPDLGTAASEILNAWTATQGEIPNNLALLQLNSFKGKKTLTACIYLGEQHQGPREIHAGLKQAEKAMNNLCGKLIEAGFISCSQEEFGAS